jgi:hypothetical protein
MLKRDKHVNSHLQNVCNKYGIDNLKFGIIELCSESVLEEREQFYIDNNNNLLNQVLIDVKRISLDKETRVKIGNTIKKRYAEGKISRYNKGSFKKGIEPWNKNKKYLSTDHLKVPKTITSEFLEGRKRFSKTTRDKLPEIYVYNSNNEFLGKWNSSMDIQEYSIKTDSIFIPHMILRNKNGRNGYSPYLLQNVNINKSFKNNTPYKGLLFKTKPL